MTVAAEGGPGLPSQPFQPAVDLTQCAPPRTVTNIGVTGTQLVTGAGFILGITWDNSGATAAARVHLHDGISTAGPIVAVWAGAAGTSGSINPSEPGIYFSQGLDYELVAGFTEITITYVPLLQPF